MSKITDMHRVFIDLSSSILYENKEFKGTWFAGYKEGRTEYVSVEEAEVITYNFVLNTLNKYSNNLEFAESLLMRKLVKEIENNKPNFTRSISKAFKYEPI